MADTKQTREDLKKFFKKYSSPTVAQWHTVLDSVLNILDDLPLSVEQVQGLNKQIEDIKEQIKNLGVNEETLNKINEVKEELKNAIAKKADQAGSGAGYVPHLTELRNDDSFPVGTIAQYIGETDEEKDLIRGFFYEKKAPNEGFNVQSPDGSTRWGENVKLEYIKDYKYFKTVEDADKNNLTTEKVYQFTNSLSDSGKPCYFICSELTDGITKGRINHDINMKMTFYDAVATKAAEWQIIQTSPAMM